MGKSGGAKSVKEMADVQILSPMSRRQRECRSKLPKRLKFPGAALVAGIRPDSIRFDRGQEFAKRHQADASFRAST
eukprot:5346006-Pyramimonas_sp.AAC.1